MMESFVDWYKRHHEGRSPFPWQVVLAERIAKGEPPSEIIVPTGAGKTVIIAVWIWAHAQNFAVPTRLIYVIDRHLLVDSVTDYAERLCSFTKEGIQVIKMRGGITIDNAWLMAPHMPAIIVSTVDQVGSRLLFRGYGVSGTVAPIHAGLVGNDAFIVLDEAHISSSFLDTLSEIDVLRSQEQAPWFFTAMTATPQKIQDAVALTEEDLNHPVLRQRLHASKLAKLKKVVPDRFVAEMVEQAKSMRQAGAAVIGVICNTTNDARRVFECLGDTKKALITGRIRQPERTAILERYLPLIANGSRRSEAPDDRAPIYVVATQSIEVGADLDFDAVVTQSAPLDALRQRFGRLDRSGLLGNSQAVIVHKDLGPQDECHVYGKVLLKKTWSWLDKAQTGKGKNKHVDFGILAMDKLTLKSDPPVREHARSYTLTPTLLRKLRQTEPPIAVDIAPLLHGEQHDLSTVSLVWRDDLGVDMNMWSVITDAVRPVMAETMPCPLYALKHWLGRRKVVVQSRVTMADRIKPGDTVIVPSSYGGYDQWGWHPESDVPVIDVGNQFSKIVRLAGVESDCDLALALKDAGIEHIMNPVAHPYPAGLLVREANRRTQSQAVLLDAHLKGVANVARSFSKDDTVIEAALQHDIGKQDPRFQRKLGCNGRILAKSGHVSLVARRQAEKFCGLPEGWRHEFNSVVLLSSTASELLRYLVATHHGYGRTVLPLAGDEQLWYSIDGPNWGRMTKQLNEQYGAWGLAYLEALVRLADWQQSKVEQENYASI